VRLIAGNLEQKFRKTTLKRQKIKVKRQKKRQIEDKRQKNKCEGRRAEG
jgi:hypothetical protein